MPPTKPRKIRVEEQIIINDFFVGHERDQGFREFETGGEIYKFTKHDGYNYSVKFGGRIIRLNVSVDPEIDPTPK